MRVAPHGMIVVECHCGGVGSGPIGTNVECPDCKCCGRIDVDEAGFGVVEKRLYSANCFPGPNEEPTGMKLRMVLN